MRTNSGISVNADWDVTGTVTPENMNALTRSIQYDYVITQQMLDGQSGEVNVDALLGGGIVNGRTGEYHILINAVVPSNVVLYFPCDSVGGASGSLRIHVHTIGKFTAKIGTSGIPYITHLFHTHGETEAVTFLTVGRNTYVGAFIIATPPNLPAGAVFVYEKALQGIPVGAQAGDVRQEAWMSNDIGSGASSGIVRLSYPDNNGNFIRQACCGKAILDPMLGLLPSTPLTFSNATQVEWVTWHSRGKVTSPYVEHNDEKTLYIDTDSMVEGVVYEVAIRCYCDIAAAGEDVAGGMAVSKNEGVVVDVAYTIPTLAGFGISSVTGDDLWTPSASIGVRDIAVRLTEIASTPMMDEQVAYAPNFIGNVYLMKADGKVNILGY